MEAILEKVRARMGTIRTPGNGSLVYKDECMFSFDTPFSTGGIAVNLNSWQGFGEQFVKRDHERTKNGLYLLQKWKTVPKTEEELEATKNQITEGKLIIGASDVKVDKFHSLLLMPEGEEIPLPSTDIPMMVTQVCHAVIENDGASLKESAAAYVEEFVANESKYAATLEQLPTGGKKIPSNPKLWKCDETGVTENLWLNLSTGFIGSGRKNWDGTGGNGAAERHFEATGKKYPLAVKLGTITPHGADIFSYAPDENDMVKDALLAQHLAHWGIDTMNMEKTEKSMAELNVALNVEYDWSKITEGDGTDLKPLSGGGHVGIANLGNSCYMNSVVQVLFSLNEIKTRYVENGAADKIFNTSPENPNNDFVTQMAKLGVGLTSDRYAAVPKDKGEGEVAASEVCVRPMSFRSLVGRGHSEFSSSRQQDAAEYLQHLLDVMTKAERTSKDRLGGDTTHPSASHFDMTIEERLCCVESTQVRYVSAKSNILRLNVPIEAAENATEYKEYQETKRAKISVEVDKNEAAVVPRVPFSACLNQFLADESIPDFFSSALNRKTLAKKSQRFKTFPKYLAIQINRYYVSETWEPKKLDVEVPMPESIDLEQYRGKGLQENETQLPENVDQSAGPPAEVEIDMGMVIQLTHMGFSENGCKRAVKACGAQGIEAASNWIFEHMEDADFNNSLETTSAAKSNEKAKPSDEQLMMITSLGFTNEQAEAALVATDLSTERAAEWLFSRMDNLDAAVAEVNATQSNSDVLATDEDATTSDVDDGPGKYELISIISHLGKNTGSGHYVCHIKRNNQWAIFNDRKVGESKSPPLDVGYLYIYKRVD
eukprot:m.159692 g.159692  ORF g.159692 m.159692 type:complete len:829 (-) comp31148_c0_seq1:27-2513(-)